MIDRIELTNFKAFRDLSVTIAPLTLLAGVNSVGKSTVLQALGLMRQSYIEGSLAHGLVLNGDYVQLGTGQDVLHEDYDSIAGRAEVGITLTSQVGRASWRANYEATADVLHLIEASEDSSDVDKSLGIFSRGFQYIRADRLGPVVLHPRSLELARRDGFLGCQGQYTVNFLREHSDDRVSNAAVIKDNSPSSQLLDQINSWLSEVSPGVSARVEEISGTDLIKLDFGFFGSAGLNSSNRYRPTNVGFGLSYVLPIITALITAEPGSVVILENPEAHLHPHGQTMMGKLAALAATVDCRILIETHSEHLLNGVRLAVKSAALDPGRVAVHYFSRNDEGHAFVESPAINAGGMLSSWPIGFFDETETNLADLLS